MHNLAKILVLLVSAFSFITYLGGTALAEPEYNQLSSEEERIIIRKGTEAPFSGEYYNLFDRGVYHCKRCNAALYNSDDKFKSGCGWPSFDDEIKGAVKRQEDADGRRTEIVCANCGAHLGHIFNGEQLTEKDVRHCVNSTSMVFVPAAAEPDPQKAYFAGGCFWGVEYLFEHKAGVMDAVSGYMGGSLEGPTYREVCSGTSGHLETVAVTYDPALISFEELAKFFFEIHDPTQTDGQGPDIGPQYLSAVFYNNDAEKKILHELIDKLKAKGYDIVSKVRPTETFWPAEACHQNYYDRKKQQPYCHIYQKRF
jgi:peptide methionine sulfoxide reductase msrA/msrB